ncbi:MAG: M20/M25/M40 family metallo-hydrolase [Spirochaetes bacterium]|nr:M20/M25/M40 family metallo-hydrolase [Spirochaetota bacterium]
MDRDTGGRGYRILIAAGLMALPLFVALLRLVMQGIPAPHGTGAPAGEFSAARAMAELRVIAAEIHPIGSKAHERVRRHLLGRLRETGLELSEQKCIGARSWFPNFHIAGTVHNLAVKIPGSSSRGSVLIMAHYDSVDTGPGANDDGAAVAAMLESIRVLRSGAMLKNDLVFLFTDGEEAGLLGASAFLDGHPWMRDVKLVINLESRGAGGASTLFETGEGNGRVIGDFIRRDDHPVGNSLTNAIYSLLPNDTDFTVFKEAGYQGLNFAYIKNLTVYHTMLDAVGNVDTASLQHHGSHIISLARFYGNDSLEGLRSPDAVYFTLLGNVMVRYSGLVSAVLSGVIVLCALGSVLLSLRRRRIRAGMVAAGAAIVLFSTALVSGLLALLWRILLALHPGYAAMTMGDLYNSGWYAAAFTALTVFLYGLLVHLLRRRVDPTHLFAGGVLWWTIMLAATAVLIPGGSFLLQWPLLFAAIQLYCIPDPVSTPPAGSVPAALLSLPAVLLLADLLHSLYVGLSISNAVAPAALCLMLYLFLMTPLFQEVLHRSATLLLGSAAAVAAASLIGGSITAGFDETHPRPNSLVYASAAGSGPLWVSCDAETDSWTSQFFPGGGRRGALPEFYPISDRCLRKPYGFLLHEAPRLPLPGPTARVLSDRKGERRRLEVRFSLGGEALGMILYIRDAERRIDGLAVCGKQLRRIDPARLKPGHRILYEQVDLKNWIAIRLQALPPGGVDLSVTTTPGSPVEVLCVEQYRLPDLERMGYRPRPPGMIPAPDFLVRDAMLVSRGFTF